MSTLLIDIGNSRIKWGRAGQHGAQHLRAIAHRGRPAEAATEIFDSLTATPDRIVGCNVAGESVSQCIDSLAETRFSLMTEWVSVGRESLGVTNAYADVSRLGCDRWLAVLAAYNLANRAALVVDIGTAATIDAVYANGRHAGGMILPGADLMAGALYGETQRIRAGSDELRDPTEALEFFAADTDMAVQNGSIAALVGSIEFAWSGFTAVAPDASLVITGGGAAGIIRHLSMNVDHRPALVLDGLWLLANSGKKICEI